VSSSPPIIEDRLGVNASTATDGTLRAIANYSGAAKNTRALPGLGWRRPGRLGLYGPYDNQGLDLRHERSSNPGRTTSRRVHGRQQPVQQRRHHARRDAPRRLTVGRRGDSSYCGAVRRTVSIISRGRSRSASAGPSGRASAA
jgi:hypothetical protein